MTRPELEWASLALIERTFKVCQSALDASGGAAQDLDRVILVGGATRMPMVARKVEQFFARAPIVRINPDEVVALGAAIQAALLDRTRRPIDEAAPPPRIHESSVVIALPEEEPPPSAVDISLPVVDSKAQIPVAKPEPPPPPAPRPPAATQFLPASSGKPLVFDVQEPAVSPFEVELGPAPPKRAPMRTLPGVSAPAPDLAPAAPPAPDLPPMRPRQETARLAAPEVSAPAAIARPAAPRVSPLLIDVTPLSLGVETVGGFCDVLIEANTPVPCDRTRTFATAADDQTRVQLRVSQGQSRRFSENTCLGELELTGIAPGPRGAQQIAVTFEIDADGILNVRARDVATGKETAARMQLVGDQGGPGNLDAMQARQAAHPIAPLGARG
jgi:molecular chaperone DnaK